MVLADSIGSGGGRSTKLTGVRKPGREIGEILPLVVRYFSDFLDLVRRLLATATSS